MINATVDLEHYFERIGFRGPRTPSLEVLSALHVLHPAAIPFENLDPLMGRPVALDPAALERKLVHEGRGGYCYEQNGLFFHVLRALGFRVSGLAARVLWGRDEDALTPRSHMLLRIDLDGHDVIADVGFGGQTLTAPLRLEPDTEQETPHEPHRFVRIGPDEFKLQARLGDTWRSVYRFDLAEFIAADYEIANYWVSTNPQSHFRSGLIAARPVEGRRYALMNNRLAIHRPGAESEHRTLSGTAEVSSVLREVFGIRLPDAAALNSALARALEPA